MSYAMLSYRDELNNRYLVYKQRVFAGAEAYFDPKYVKPPVFLSSEAWRNLITDPQATTGERQQLLHLLPPPERHRWFRSMNSSQALAQSLLGNLAVHQQLHWLTDLVADDGTLLLGKAHLSLTNFRMEYRVNYLHEPRPTSVDVFVGGDYQVAIECKFTEADVGACSRPLLKPSDANYATAWCDGTFTHQRGRQARCSLTESGVLYWQYVPELFTWAGDDDLLPCPLHKNYQLVRNVLAACIRPDGVVAPEAGHAVLLYDERNPAFQVGGNGFAAFGQVQQALRVGSLLKKCSWQRMILHLKPNVRLPWLWEHLELKYGLH